MLILKRLLPSLVTLGMELAFASQLFFPSTALAAKHINVLWIGNSLTQAPWCTTYEGWFAEEVMTIADSSTTGVVVASYGVMLGATSISKHWSLQSGFALLDSPVVHRTDDIWQTEQVDHYDYIVLQTHTQSATVTAESTALCEYSDLALSKGVKPVIFECWDAPTKYDSASSAFTAVYEKYKSQGALFAPLFQIHQAINAEKPLTYLYNAGDPYAHVTLNGAFLSMSAFYYLFTKSRPSAYDFTLLPQCTGSDSVAAQQAYLTGKAEAVLASYYSTAIKEARPVSARCAAITQPGASRLFDFSGRSIGISPGPVPQRVHGGVLIVEQSGVGARTLIH